MHIIFGDSNCKRLYFADSDVKNISLSGQKLRQFDTLLSKVKIEHNEIVDSVIVHLGTNDIVCDSVNDVDLVENAKSALECVAKRWSNTPVAFSGFIPRRGKSAYVKSLNEPAKLVNSKMLSYCQCIKFMHYLDNDQIFLAHGKFQKDLFDA